MDNLAVSMQGITKIFNGVKANDNVDFNLRKGSIHGLLGENGAGKTTLMNILYGLYQQEAGDIYINGSKEEISSPIKAISGDRNGASAFYVGQTDDSRGECYAGQKVQKRHSS